MPYRIIVTDLMNKTATPTQPLCEPTPQKDDFINTGAGKAKVTEVRKGESMDDVDDVYAQVQ
jgi:hypothetical protein